MQLDIDFEAGLTQTYPELMDVVRACVYGCGRQMKSIAADLDLSPSELSRKLAHNPNDQRHLHVEELAALIEACGDRGLDIVYWQIERHLQDRGQRQERAREKLLQIAPLFQALLQQAMPELAPSGEPVGRGR